MTAPGSFGDTEVPPEYQSQILTSAARWGVDPAILAAQLSAESSFNRWAVSPDGAEGIAQFMPGTAKSLGIDPYNVSQAIDGMAELDAKYVKEFGTIAEALAAYNAGPGAVEKYGGVPPYAETQQYVTRVLAAAHAAADSAFAAPVNAVTDSLPGLTKLFTSLTAGVFWRRIGVGTFGLFLLLIGVYLMLSKQEGTMRVVRKIEGVVK